jgi:acyl carrier protein
MTSEVIENWLVTHVAALLQTTCDEIDPQEPFDRYGLDSAEAIGLTGELEDWLQCPISPTLLYDYPTIEALATHLAKKTDSQVEK